MEDAASLFGVENQDSNDIFASLGGDGVAPDSSDDWLQPSAPTNTSIPPPPVRDAPLEAPVEPAKNYNPYAPPTNSYNPPASSYTPAVNSYTPPANPYTPSTPAQSTFNAYAPPVPSPSTPYSPQYSAASTNRYETTTTPFSAQKVAVPPPPAPATSTLNRPKISNAYDPPIFTSSRRQPSATSQNSAYARYASPLPPAPPPAGQFTSSGYAIPPPPPPQERASPVPNWSAAPPPPPHMASSPYSAYAEPPIRSTSPTKTLPPPPPPRTSSRAESVTRSSIDQVQRTASPASFATPSHYSPETQSNVAAPERTASPASVHSLDRTRSPPANPYMPRAPSPLKKSSMSAYDPPPPPPAVNGHASHAPNGMYNSLPKSHPVPPPLPRNRSESSGSIYDIPPMQTGHSSQVPPPLPRNRSESSGSIYDPPSMKTGHLTQQRSETDYGAYSSRYNYGAAPLEAPVIDHSLSQEVLVKPAQTSAYAPSPSLLGANDPLGRTSSRAPVFSFGFGGKFLTCFHGASINTGFDVALASKNSTGIQVRLLNKIIPQSALETTAVVFPGPLFSDPGTPTMGLVRTTTASGQTKAKKAKLVKYLTDRASEISQAIGYLHTGSMEAYSAEGKLVLVNLLKVLVENDGKLSGTPQIDLAVRAALVPRLDIAAGENSDVSDPSSFTSIADLQRPLDNGMFPTTTSNGGEAPIMAPVLRPEALEKIQEFLVRGERRKAYHFALDEKLWAHAMIIASSVDRDAWKEAVNEFLRAELGPNSLGDSAQLKNGREGLRVAYSLYSGQGAAAVQEMVPQNLLSRAAGRLQLPTAAPHKTPLTPNFAAPATANNIPTESLASWAETAAMLLSSPMTSDTSAALTALGDQLLAHQWVEAAHACYLLSPQTSPLGGLGNATARVVLLGSKSPQIWTSFYKDSDPTILTEILEFGLSLNTPAKGQDAFYGFPHLQAYRFIRAIGLAELGEMQLASRYCEAISVSFSRGSPYYTPILVDQLKALSDRIVGLDHGEKSGFWKSTPSLDTIGRFLEGRFTKLVTGDADPSTPTDDQMRISDANSGPFSQYSYISSSATSSTSPSPQPSLYNLNAQPPPPPARTGSAMGQSNLRSHAPIDRAASAMEHVRRKPSSPAPVPRIASANASTTTFAQAPSYVSAYSNYSPNPYSPNMATPRPTQETTSREEDTEGGQEVSWWSYSNGNDDSANQTPMAATFMQVDAGVNSNADGFISLMPDSSYTVESGNSRQRQSLSHEEDEEDDLGFGNSKKPKKEANGEHQAAAASGPTTAPAAAEPQRPDVKPAPAAASGSWFGRWWKRPDAATTPGPVKANLGEEVSFYYDKEQKRWVNKKAGAEEAKPATPPPPPPSRPQTASPGMTGPRPGGMTPPPPRAASVFGDANGTGNGMHKPPMRARSNLAPTPEPDSHRNLSTPSPPPGPPGRPKSQASKRAIRSRYVDVFQQEGESAA
ncbi:Protein transport protein sec16 [Mycena indigotica]|uniref:Protein transport protein sec16 n=1 Tax=Mycena indigotica TaxID=2126181 RepID=A0A8H6SBP5_9AGAR|nr:Protein transport protein sec16 [Mycena indigotica]KAF7294895.1 Protein transport protein sec16 [Mycena indigotica]